MIDKNKENADYNAKYANWNKGYDDIFLEISEIREIQNKTLFDLNNKGLMLNKYYSRIRGLYTTLAHQVIDRALLQKQLDKIENVLFSDKYIKGIQDGSNTREIDLKIYRALRLYFQMMCESFSKNGLTMKVIKEQKDDPYTAVMRGYN